MEIKFLSELNFPFPPVFVMRYTLHFMHLSLLYCRRYTTARCIVLPGSLPHGCSYYAFRKQKNNPPPFLKKIFSIEWLKLVESKSRSNRTESCLSSTFLQTKTTSRWKWPGKTGMILSYQLRLEKEHFSSGKLRNAQLQDFIRGNAVRIAFHVGLKN